MQRSNPTTANYTNSTTKRLLENELYLVQKLTVKGVQFLRDQLVCSETSLSLFLQHSDP